MKIHGKHQIRKKIIYRTVIIYTITLLVTLLASILTLLPPLKERALTSARNVNAQIVQQTDYLLSSIQDYSEDITSSDSFKSAFANYMNNPGSTRYYQMVCLNLNKLASLRENVRNVIVESEDGQVFHSIVQVYGSDLSLLKTDWYKALRATDYASGFSSVYSINDSGHNIYTAAYCKNFYLNNDRLTVTVFFRMTEALSITRSLAAKSLDNYLWLDHANEPFYPLNSTEWSKKIAIKLADATFYKSDAFKLFGGYNFVSISKQSQWKIISFISEISLFKTFSGYFFTILLLFIVLLSVAVSIIVSTVTSITTPVSQLAATMSKAAKGNLEVVSTIDTDDEIGELSKIFNHMVEDLKDYINKLLEKEEMEQRMKYSLLISQIDPHFIYNTMNTINYLARKGLNEDITVINTALIKILQDRLRVNNIEIFDTIEQEVNIVRQYIIIQRYRYGNDIEVIWDIDESLFSTQIPKNIIQPLVENAFFHGLTDEEGSDMSGYITISIITQENRIVIKVSDSGRGIEPSKLQQLNTFRSSTDPNNRGKHIGLMNIRERLIYIYGNQDCMLIESTPSKGTCVTLVLESSQKKQLQYEV